MGGHGALLCAFRNPGKYKSVSTFAPVCNSQKCVPFKEAFDLYLGPNSESHKEWNAMELVKNYNGPPLCILIDQVMYLHFYTIKCQGYFFMVIN